jgi:two-component system sensor histidine kinase RpfC
MNSRAALQVEVIDTGEGIPADVQPYIFERFRQADNSVRRRHGGAGLGTSIAKHLVELMGGEIGFESEFGRGTRFWFRIPITSPSQRRDLLLNFPGNTGIVFVTNDTKRCEQITGTLGELSIPNAAITSLSADEVGNKNIETTAPYCVIADCASLTDGMVTQIPAVLWQKNSCYIALNNGSYERGRLLGLGYEQVAYSPSELKNSLLFAACKLGTCKVTESHNALHPTTDSDHIKRVLIAEDSDMNRQVFRGILEYMGLDVNFANTGIEALKRLKEDIYDLLIVDIQMPEMSGFEVISRYKSLYGGKSRIPIVVVTGDVTKEVQDECEELGVDRFIAKPVESERLRGVIAELLTV